MKPMQFTATAAAIAALLLAGWATGARAAPPLITTEAEALDRGQCQWQYGRDNAKAGNLKARGWSTQVGCGVSRNTQLDVGFARAQASGDNSDAIYLLGKTQTVRSNEPGGTAVAVAYSWLGERERGTDTRTDTLTLGLLVSKELVSGFTGHINFAQGRRKPPHLGPGR
jgi:hypothetical protein